MHKYFWASFFVAVSLAFIPTAVSAATGIETCQAQKKEKDCSHCYGRVGKQIPKCLYNCANGLGGRSGKYKYVR